MWVLATLETLLSFHYWLSVYSTESSKLFHGGSKKTVYNYLWNYEVNKQQLKTITDRTESTD